MTMRRALACAAALALAAAAPLASAQRAGPDSPAVPAVAGTAPPPPSGSSAPAAASAARPTGKPVSARLRPAPDIAAAGAASGAASGAARSASPSASMPLPSAAPPGPPPDNADIAVPCPAGLPTLSNGVACFQGRDSAGAYYWIAVPGDWNGVLVLHAHGGPEFGPPQAERTARDLKRWAVMLRAGYAWAGSTYRQGGVAVRAAAEDTERLRTIFDARFGKPRITILHGQSWGAGVAAKAAEMYADRYDGVLLSSGVLGGGTRSYDFRLDLRVIYQALCANHPKPDEPAYPLWQGLPLDSRLTHAELNRRIDECTGLSQSRAQRSAAQQTRLDTLLRVVRIPERTLASHMHWATWGFQDIVFKRLGGANPFGNAGARYFGSPDDDDLNRRVLRYAADAKAVERFAADADLTGKIKAPMLTVHAIDDPTAFVELETVFRETMAGAGQSGNLVQTYTDEHDHSYLQDAEYVALTQALLGWIERREKPTAASVAARCAELQTALASKCLFVVDYTSGPIGARVAPRDPPAR